jgi:glycosyltransferase involved in cell wall biosynthesis
VAGQSVAPAEIIVADDGSTDETRALVAHWQSRLQIPLVHCWQPDDGYRLARIRNLALARATAHYLLFLDGDQILHRHFVADHVRAARRRTVVRGSRAFLSPEWTQIALASGRLPRWWHSGVWRRAAAFRSLPLSRVLYDWRPRDVEGHNIACWRADAVEVNGFEEAFRGWGGEDDDFVARLLHLGLTKRRLRFSALVYHLDHPAVSRAAEAENQTLFRETVATGRVRARVGLDQLSNRTP